mgnify:CR=1 FL=1
MSTVEMIAKILQVVVALGIFNVWFLRVNKPTNYRGGNATNMEEEFKVYGFSKSFMLAVGALKVIFAMFLLLGLWVPEVACVGALGLSLLMLAAFSMHLKVRDPIMKGIPSLLMFAMSALVFLASRP